MSEHDRNELQASTSALSLLRAAVSSRAAAVASQSGDDQLPPARAVPEPPHSVAQSAANGVLHTVAQSTATGAASPCDARIEPAAHGETIGGASTDSVAVHRSAAALLGSLQPAPSPPLPPRPTAPTAIQTALFEPEAVPQGSPRPAAPRAGKRQPTPDLASGHRDRLRARFDRGETLPDYELLELMLFRSIPRRDTKPIAKALMAEFGAFAAVLSAPATRLMAVSGVGERVVGDLRLIRAAAERLTHDALAERSVLSSTDAVVDFFRAKLRGLEREEFHVLYLDKKNKMLASECAGTGTVDHTPVYPREVLKRALELGASAVVLVHNHPSGDPTPSRADIAMTAKIIDGATPLGLSVHDHIIVGDNTYTSLRGEGYV